jgi:arylsulfatase A-like enzyme
MKPALSHRFGVVVVAAALLSVSTRLDGAASPRPNVLLVLSDDHSAPHVGCYGNPEIKTPNLDRFAAAGLRLDRAYVSCPQCVPSRATYMTGRSPVGIQMTRFSAPLPAEVVTFPELLRAKGYFTGICGRTFHLDGSPSSSPNSQAVFEKHGLRTFQKRVDFLRVSNQKAAVGELREFLDLVPKGAPFLLWVNFNDPHRPLDAHAIPQPHDPERLTLPAHYPDTRLVREDFARY